MPGPPLPDIPIVSNVDGRRARFGAGLVLVGVLLLSTGFSLAAFAASEGKVVLCHFAGREGTDKGQTIEVSPAAALAHIDEHGTPRAGHEDDYLGPCAEDSTTSTAGQSTSSTIEPVTSSTSQSTTSSTSESSTTSSTHPITTSTAASQSTTSSVGEESTSTTDGAAVSDITEATPPTSPEVTTPVGPTPGAGVVPEPSSATDGPTAADDSDDGSGDQSAEELPYTGPSTFLVIPGVLLVAAGAFAVFAGGGVVALSGGHVAGEQSAIRLGWHRGRHEA